MRESCTHLCSEWGRRRGDARLVPAVKKPQGSCRRADQSDGEKQQVLGEGVRGWKHGMESSRCGVPQEIPRSLLPQVQTHHQGSLLRLPQEGESFESQAPYLEPLMALTATCLLLQAFVLLSPHPYELGAGPLLYCVPLSSDQSASARPCTANT